jgi:uncharacterized protein
MKQFVVKVTGRCDQGCDDCYMYDLKEDGIAIGSPDWSDMSPVTVNRLVARAREAVQRGEPVYLVLHGGEPLLVPEICLYAANAFRSAFGSATDVRVQTGGVPLGRKPSLVAPLRDARIDIGVSYEGYADLHDRTRPLLGGRASSALVERGIEAARDAGALASIYTRIFLSADPVSCYERVVGEFAPRMWDLLLMDGSWKRRPPGLAGRALPVDGPPWQVDPGPAPYHRFLAPVWELWIADRLAGRTVTEVRIFTQAIRALRGAPETETFGGSIEGLVTIGPRGAIEHLDRLRTIAKGAKDTGLNVAEPGALVEYFRQHALRRALPRTCRPCRWRGACQGGNYAHRWDGASWDNPTIYCHDMNALLEMVQTAIAAEPRVLLLGARAGDVLSIGAEHEDLLSLVDADLPGSDRQAVRQAARTGLVLVAPIAEQIALGALVAVSGDGALTLRLRDEGQAGLLTMLLGDVLENAPQRPLHVARPEPAHISSLRANGFEGGSERMVLSG